MRRARPATATNSRRWWSGRVWLRSSPHIGGIGTPWIGPAPARPRSPGRHEPRQLGRVVLAVAVEGHHREGAVGDRSREAGPQRGPLAPVGVLREDGGAGGRGAPRRRVRGSVVDDEDRQVRGGRPDDGADPWGL